MKNLHKDSIDEVTDQSNKLPNSYVDFDKVKNIQIIEEKTKQKKYV